MGVYYEAYVGFGLLVNRDEVGVDKFYELVEEVGLPDGFVSVFGGDKMNSNNECLLIGPRNLVHRVFHSLYDNNFGAVRMEASKGLTAVEAHPILIEFAAANGVDPDIGFFGVSSVG